MWDGVGLMSLDRISIGGLDVLYNIGAERVHCIGTFKTEYFVHTRYLQPISSLN